MVFLDSLVDSLVDSMLNSVLETVRHSSTVEIEGSWEGSMMVIELQQVGSYINQVLRLGRESSTRTDFPIARYILIISYIVTSPVPLIPRIPRSS